MKRKLGEKISPVVETILIIALGIIIAIATAYWMATLSPVSLSDQLVFGDVLFDQESHSSENDIVVVIKNTGAGEISIAEVKVNEKVESFIGKTVLKPGEVSALIISNVCWVSKNSYVISIGTSEGWSVSEAYIAP